MSGDFPEDWFRPSVSGTGDGDGPETVPAEPTLEQTDAVPTEVGPSEVGSAGPDQSDARPTDPGPTDATPADAEPSHAERTAVEPPHTDSAPEQQSSPTTPAAGQTPSDDGVPHEPAVHWELKEPASVPVLTSAHAARTVDLDDFLPTPQRRAVLQRRLWLFLVTVTLLALVAGLAGGALIRRALDGRATPISTTSLTPVTASNGNGSASQPWQGDTAVLVATSATASCTAPAGRDASGLYVTYDPANVLDNQPTTAWRCDGDAVNQSLEFTFAPGAQLVGVGIVNGYAKSAGTTSLYDQYRRVISVRWDLPDGSWFAQNLSENSRAVQQLMIPPVQINGVVRLTILASTAPGQRGEPSSDAVLLSTVRFLTKP